MKVLPVALILVGLAGGAPAAGEGGVWLVTVEEAAMPPASTERGGQPLDIEREPPDTGPLIEVLKPPAGSLLSVPLEIAVRFVPRSAPVDLASLRVTVVKLIGIDITERVRPYATPEGIQIPDAKLPAGEHRVRITVADASGGVSQKLLTLTVQ